MLIYRLDGIWIVGNSKGYLLLDEQLILVLTKTVLPGQQEHVVVKNIMLATEQGLTVTLGVGQYDVEGYLVTMLGENYTSMNFIIPEEEIVTDEHWLKENETVTIPETVFNGSMYNGGVSLLSTDGLGLIVTQDDYAFSKFTISYLTVDLDDIKKHDDLEVIGLFPELSIMNNETLKPKFE